MNEREKPAMSDSERKAKIRERYKGISRDELEVIPAIMPASFHEDTSDKRVAVYARVSTGDPNQTSSYELQKNHYQDMVSRHPGWHLVEIYADEGISGTSLQHRDDFIRMIADCEAGKIDLIVTKSVSRFARNVLDCIGQVRKLRALPNPVGVFFETENIYTLNSNSEMSLSFISTLVIHLRLIRRELLLFIRTDTGISRHAQPDAQGCGRRKVLNGCRDGAHLCTIGTDSHEIACRSGVHCHLTHVRASVSSVFGLFPASHPSSSQRGSDPARRALFHDRP